MNVIYLFLHIHSYSNNESLYRLKITHLSKSKENYKVFSKIFFVTKEKNKQKRTTDLSQLCNKQNLTKQSRDEFEYQIFSN